MNVPSMKVQSVRFLLCSLAVLAGACGSATEPEGETLLGRTNRGEESSVPAVNFTGQSLYTIPQETRLIADPSAGRFLVLTTNGARHYALAEVVSCGSSLAIQVGEQIGCQAGASPVLSRSYFALDRSASEVSDREILSAPEVELFVDASKGVRCGTQPADFFAMLDRLRTDLAEEAGAQAKALTWMVVRYGSPASIEVPAALLYGDEEGVSAYYYGGTSCSCTSGTCTLKSGIGWKTCDAANCSGSCTMSG
jgi:hypothetical protein